MSYIEKQFYIQHLEITSKNKISNKHKIYSEILSSTKIR